MVYSRRTHAHTHKSSSSVVTYLVLQLIQPHGQARAQSIRNRSSVMATSRATVPAAGPSLDFEGFPSLADMEVIANVYVTGQKHSVFELLVHVCTKCPSRVREFLWESSRAVAKGFCTHGDEAPAPLPNIINLQQRKAAAEAHAGLCGVHHADCIARINLESIVSRGASPTANKFRNQVRRASYLDFCTGFCS